MLVAALALLLPDHRTIAPDATAVAVTLFATDAPEATQEPNAADRWSCTRPGRSSKCSAGCSEEGAGVFLTGRNERAPKTKHAPR